jgi:hypothetical protein
MMRVMSDDDANPKAPPLARYEGPTREAPYPLSRMAPAFELVDVAREIARADETVAQMTTGKLLVLAEQMRALQERARELLERARRDAELHRVRCRFPKKPGDRLHLYRDPDGALWFSRIAPDEWVSSHASAFVASYRLEADMSFTPLEEVERRERDALDAVRLLSPPKPGER